MSSRISSKNCVNKILTLRCASMVKISRTHSFYVTGTSQDPHKRANCLTMSGTLKPGVKGHTKLIVKVLKLTCANKTVKVQG